MVHVAFDIQPIPEIFSQRLLWDLLIIGGGPAGLNAALYAKRKGLNVGILSKDIGGQLHNTSKVDNYLGLPELEGAGISKKFSEHVAQLGVPIHREAFVTSIEKSGKNFSLVLDNGSTLHSKTVLYATGGQPRKLGVKGERELANKGVSYCTTCDAPFFKDKRVIIAGGGNSAAEAVLDMMPWAKTITVVHRSEWRADAITLEKVHAVKNLTVHLQTQMLEVLGKDRVTGVRVLDKKTNKERTIVADGLFIEIGLEPNSAGVKNLVKLNERNEVIVDGTMMTSVPGLFAAGDVTNQPFKQIVIAVADGAKAALSIQQYLIHQY